MTDKQIIIDASKCEWRTGVEHCGNYECMLNRCCDYNCDWYKRRKLKQQLKAKEQECGGLKNTITNLENIRDKFSAKLDQLKAKNEELKAKIKYMEEYIQTVENARNEFEKESKFLKGENKRLKQTLTEIKEIIKKRVKIHDDIINNKQILQKISECEI